MKIKTLQIRLSEEYLKSDEEAASAFLDSVQVTNTTSELIKGEPNVWSMLVMYDLHENVESKFDKTQVELSPADKELYQRLMLWRRQRSVELSFQPYMICHASELVAIAKARPKNERELRAIKGFGEQKVARYGEDILSLINDAT
jgi:superfamily II DNA helicase RecQ